MITETEKILFEVTTYRKELSDFVDMVGTIYNLARSQDLQDLVDDRIGKVEELGISVLDVFDEDSSPMLEHRTLKMVCCAIRDFMPEDADDYVDGLASWQESEDAFRNELRLDYQASVL